MTVNPHDAEEAMRPHLGRVYDATDACKASTARTGEEPPYSLVKGQLIETSAALVKALELLGVQR